MNYEVYDDGDTRILHIYDDIDDITMQNLRALIEDLAYWSCEYFNSRSDADLEVANGCAAQIGAILGDYCTSPVYEWEWFLGGAELPIVWINSSDDVCWVEVRGIVAQTIAQWSWEASNGTADDEQTQVAYSAVAGNGFAVDFHYKVWNDMVNKVKEILDYLSSSWTETDNDGNIYLSYHDTLMSEGDTILTAERFNALRFNIGSRYSTGINTVEKGDTVYGQYFTQLTDVINDWISGI